VGCRIQRIGGGTTGLGLDKMPALFGHSSLCFAQQQSRRYGCRQSKGRCSGQKLPPADFSFQKQIFQMI
jgi:hypothetical protein